MDGGEIRWAARAERVKGKIIVRFQTLLPILKFDI